jgi:hypothetical protein
MTDDDRVLLDRLTGIAHEYNGTGPNRHGEIRPIPCGCDGFDEAYDADMLDVIGEHHLDRGIWERGDCLTDD